MAANVTAVNFTYAREDTQLFAEGYQFLRGRIALCAILKAFGIGAGDEVILQAFTCIALPVPVLASGARPVFADIDLNTFNLDPASVEERISSRTRAMVVQHTFGIPGDMEALLRIARKRGLYLIEDCCHTLASRYDGKVVGHMGDAAFSAYRWGKPLVLGIGGTAVIHAAEPRERLAAIWKAAAVPGAVDTLRTRLEYLVHEIALRPRTFWWLRDGYRRFIKMGVAIPTFPQVELAGWLADMDRAMPPYHQQQLRKRIGPAFEEAGFRRSQAEAYAQALRHIGARTWTPDARREVVYLRYPFLAAKKPRILEQARKRNVELGDWFVSAVHPHANAESQELGYREGSCPNAERAGREILTLPIYDKVTDRDVQRAIELLDDAHRQGLL